MFNKNTFSSDADYEAYLDGSANYDPTPYRENLRMDYDEEPNWCDLPEDSTCKSDELIYPEGTEIINF